MDTTRVTCIVSWSNVPYRFRLSLLLRWRGGSKHWKTIRSSSNWLRVWNLTAVRSKEKILYARSWNNSYRCPYLRIWLLLRGTLLLSLKVFLSLSLSLISFFLFSFARISSLCFRLLIFVSFPYSLDFQCLNVCSFVCSPPPFFSSSLFHALKMMITRRFSCCQVLWTVSNHLGEIWIAHFRGWCCLCFLLFFLSCFFTALINFVFPPFGDLMYTFGYDWRIFFFLSQSSLFCESWVGKGYECLRCRCSCTFFSPWITHPSLSSRMLLSLLFVFFVGWFSQIALWSVWNIVEREKRLEHSLHSRHHIVNNGLIDSTSTKSRSAQLCQELSVRLIEIRLFLISLLCLPLSLFLSLILSFSHSLCLSCIRQWHLLRRICASLEHGDC